MNQIEIATLMRRAHRSLRSARNLMEDGDYDFAVSRAYYAMFYATSAVLLSRDIKRSKHSGVIAAFGEHFVKQGHFTPLQHKMLQAAFRDRGEGDYEGMFPARPDVEQRLTEATELVDAVATFLRVQGVDTDRPSG